MKAGKQTTLRAQAVVHGIGVHSGAAASLTLKPAAADSGIVFVRTGRDGEADRRVRADVRAVTATEFATVLGDAMGPLCSTAEHVLAALAGLGIDNAVVEIDGPEVPIMDGSAAPFVAAIETAGIVALASSKRYIKVLKPIGVTQGDAFGELRPYGRGFRLEVEIDFDHPLIGHQTTALDVDADSFRNELSRARTFGFLRDVNALWDAGYARGSSLDNTLVVSEDRVLNPQGLRFPDEFARHKALDALGDLALAGAPLIGVYRSRRGGHRLNHAVLSALMADSSAWTMVDAAELAAPMAHQAPRRGIRGHADGATPLAVPAFGPEMS